MNLEFRNMNMIEYVFRGVIIILTASSIVDFSCSPVGLRRFIICNASFNLMLAGWMLESLESDGCWLDIIGFRLRRQWTGDIWWNVENCDDGDAGRGLENCGWLRGASAVELELIIGLELDCGEDGRERSRRRYSRTAAAGYTRWRCEGIVGGYKERVRWN